MAMPDLRVEVAFSTGADTGTLLQLDDPTRGKLNTGTLGSTSMDVPVWTDVTEWVRSGSVTRGSTRVDNPIITYEAGTCSVVLRNDDRRFDPSYLDGPYTEVTALVTGEEERLNSNTTFESGTSGWTGFFGTLTQASDQVYSGSFSGKFVPSGTDAGPFVASDWVAHTAGETYQIKLRIRSAVARTVFLSLHWYDATPTFLSASTSDAIGVPAGVWTQITFSAVAPAGATQGPALISMTGTPAASNILWLDEAEYSHLPYERITQVTAMRAMRVYAAWAGVYYELFSGYVDQWDVNWYEPGYSECVLTATDAFKVLAGIDRAAVAPTGGGQDAGTRVNTILDSAGWPAVSRIVYPGDSFLQETDLSGDALSELQAVAASELGELYVDGGGRVWFRSRSALLTETRSNTSQATFGDGGGAELPYTELAIATDDATFFNEVRVTRAGGAEQSAEDTASQVTFYRKTYKPGSDVLLQTDADALNYANWLLHVASEPEIRFTELGISPRAADSTLFPQALGRLIGDRITVVRRPPGGGDAISKEHFIRGVQHDFAPQAWNTKWTLQDASRFGSFFVLDHAELGQLDAGNALSF